MDESESCCVNCRNVTNCGTCHNCLGKVKFGGDGRNHQRCVQRICLQLHPNATPYDRGTSESKGTIASAPSKAGASKSVSSSCKSPKRKNSSLEPVLAPQPSKKQRATTATIRSNNICPEPVLTPTLPRAASTTTYNAAVSKRNRCLTCPGCTVEDCGVCIHCKGKRKFGGDGKCHMPCLQRYCHVLYPRITPTGYRARDRSSRYQGSHSKNSTANTTNTLTAMTNDADAVSQTIKDTTQSSTTVVTKPKKIPRQKAANQPKTKGKPTPPPPQPCRECVGCQQTQDCHECLHCLQNMQRTNKKTLTTNNKNALVHLCFHRRCYRLLAMGFTQQLHFSSSSSIPTYFPYDDIARTKLSKNFTDPGTRTVEVSADPGTVEEQRDVVVPSNDECKKPTSNIGDRSSVNPYFSLTEYLSQQIDAQRFDDSDNDNGDDEDRDKSNGNKMLYGLHQPPAPITNVCTGCSGSRDQELNAEDDDDGDDDDHPVLLCDGVQCGREYHIACCIPPLASVPDDNGDDEPWYCYDCCKDGTTLLLQQYLDKNDKEMIDYYSNTVQGKSNISFVEYRLQQELNIKTSAHTKRKIVHPTPPESELVIGAMIHSLALCDGNKLARTRGAHEHRESLTPEEYIGKPIRLHDRNHDMYHTGRIVAFRNAVSLASWGEEQLASTSSNDTAASIASLSTIPNIEFLVRFPAGKDNRKSTYHHWIRLEEHTLSIGSTLVWARITASQWKPSIIWLRTSLALIPTMNTMDRSNVDSTIDISKTKHKVCALVRTVGDEIYSVINVRDQCVDLSDTDATKQHLYSHPDNMLLFSIARTERAEQSRVQDWFQLKQIDPMGPAVLSSRDYWTLRELYPTPEDKTNTLDMTYLLPNARRSLDRSKLVRMLHQRGYLLSKDDIASISCASKAFNNRTTILDLCLETSNCNDPTASIR